MAESVSRPERPRRMEELVQKVIAAAKANQGISLDGMTARGNAALIDPHTPINPDNQTAGGYMGANLQRARAPGSLEGLGQPWSERASWADMRVESMLFTPAVYTRRVQRTPARRGPFGIGSRPATYVFESSPMRAPDEQELVTCAYEFMPSRDHADSALSGAKVPAYLTPDGRSGNRHFYALLLPRSLAEQLLHAVVESGPDVARRVGDELVQQFAPRDYRDRWNAEKPHDLSSPLGAYQWFPPAFALPNDVPLRVYNEADLAAQPSEVAVRRP